jgi:PAS domain S-box-containing protein
LTISLAGSAVWGDSDADYWSLFAEAPVAFFSIGTDGRIRVANRRALQLVGYRPEELAGRFILDLYPEGSSGKHRARKVFQSFCNGAETHGQVIEMQRADGTRVWVSLTVRPVRDAEGRIVASCSMVQEIGTSSHSDSQQIPFWESPNGDTRVVRSSLAANHSTGPETQLDRVLIKLAGRAMLLREREIDWLQAAGNYVQVHARAKSCLLRRTMNQMEAKLDPRQFVRIHRSTIVNINSIKELRPWNWGDWHVVLQDATQLTLSRSYQKKLEGRLRKLA